MKRILAFLALASCAFAGTWMASPGKGSHAAAGGGGVTYSDNFTTDSITGGSWTVVEPTMTVSGGTLNVGSAGGGGDEENATIYTIGQLNTLNGYVKFSLPVSSGTTYPAIIFRYTAQGAPMYRVYFWVSENTVTFVSSTSTTAGLATDQSASLTVNATDSFGVTWTGTTTNLEIRIWRNPVANAPTSASLWDGGAAGVTFTNNPTNTADTGKYVGFGGEKGNAEAISYDNWFAGDLP